MQKLLVRLVMAHVCVTSVWGSPILRRFCSTGIVHRYRIPDQGKTNAYLLITDSFRSQLPSSIAAITSFSQLPAGTRLFLNRDMAYSTNQPTRPRFTYSATYVPREGRFLFGASLTEIYRTEDVPIATTIEEYMVNEPLDIGEAHVLGTSPFLNYTMEFTITAATLNAMAAEVGVPDFTDAKQNRVLLALTALAAPSTVNVVRVAKQALSLSQEQLENHLLHKHVPTIPPRSVREVERYGYLCELASYAQRSAHADRASALTQHLLAQLGG